MLVSDVVGTTMQELQTLLADFDRLVGRTRECVDHEEAMQLAGQLTVVTHELRLQLGDSPAARAVQQTCDFAHLVLAGGSRRTAWLIVLDADRMRTQSVTHHYLEAGRKRQLAR